MDKIQYVVLTGLTYFSLLASKTSAQSIETPFIFESSDSNSSEQLRDPFWKSMEGMGFGPLHLFLGVILLLLFNAILCISCSKCHEMRPVKPIEMSIASSLQTPLNIDADLPKKRVIFLRNYPAYAI